MTPDIVGRVAAGAANVQPLGNTNPMPVKDMSVAAGLPGGPGGPLSPGQPPVCLPLPRPCTPATRGANTVIFAGSFAWICVNAYWGNPVAIAGCSAMFIGWVANALGIRIK